MKAHSISRAATALLLVGAVTPAYSTVRMGQEHFFGRGSRGPYSLSRQAVEPRTESVRVNGRHMVPGRDYFFDAGMGALAFSESVGQGDVIDVDYQYDDATAHAPTALGGSFGLLASTNAGLGLSYSFKPDANGNQKLTGLGFTGQAMVAGSSLSTNFMTDQTAKGSGTDAQNIQIAMKRDQGAFKYNMGFSQVGKQFSQASALNLVKGAKAFNFDGSLQLASNSQLSFKNVQTATPDAKTGVVKETSLLSGKMALALAPGTQFTALHERQSEGQDGKTKESAVDRLQLDQKMGKNAGASLVQETVTQGQNGNSETVKATRLVTNATGAHGLKVETGLALTDSSKAGSARDASLKLQSGDGPTKMALAVTDRQADAGDLRTHSLSLENTARSGLRLAANLTGDNGKNGSHENGLLSVENQSGKSLKWGLGLASFGGSEKRGSGTRFSLAASPSKGLSFSGSRSDDRTNVGDTSSTRLALDAAGALGMKFSGTYASDDKGTKDIESSKMKLEAAPLDAVKLVATRNEDHNEKVDATATKVNVDANASKALKIAANYTADDDGKVQKASEGVHIEAKPVNALKLTAAVGQKTDETGTGNSKSVGFEAKPIEALKVSASYADATATTGDTSVREAGLSITPVKDKISVAGTYRNETKATGDVMVATLQADIKPVEALAVSGYYKQRETGTADPINTLNAEVSLKPMGAFQMVGTYSANPEEKNEVLRLVRRGMKLKTSLGGLTFSGGYLQEQSLVNNDAGARAEFTLGLRFSKYAQLQGGFQQTVGSVRGYKPMLAYNMKYNHDIGSDFHLLLEGDVTRRDDVAADQRQEVKATANLGIRF